MKEKEICFEFGLTKQAGIPHNISSRVKVALRIDAVTYGQGRPSFDYKLLELVTREGYRLQSRRLSIRNRRRLREAIYDRICDELIYYP